jgi:hypothetical protein
VELGLIVVTTVVQLAIFRAMGWIGRAPLKLPPLRTLDPRTLPGRRRQH